MGNRLRSKLCKGKRKGWIRLPAVLLAQLCGRLSENIKAASGVPFAQLLCRTNARRDLSELVSLFTFSTRSPIVRDSRNYGFGSCSVASSSTCLPPPSPLTPLVLRPPSPFAVVITRTAGRSNRPCHSPCLGADSSRLCAAPPDVSTSAAFHRPLYYAFILKMDKIISAA
jgi:hypothetical protein